MCKALCAELGRYAEDLNTVPTLVVSPPSVGHVRQTMACAKTQKQTGTSNVQPVERGFPA